jgi:adenylate kinase family enzyme
MIEKYGFTHLSAGDLIRAVTEDSTTEKGRYFNDMMAQGKLISTVRKCQRSQENLFSLIGRYSWLT